MALNINKPAPPPAEAPKGTTLGLLGMATAKALDDTAIGIVDNPDIYSPGDEELQVGSPDYEPAATLQDKVDRVIALEKQVAAILANPLIKQHAEASKELKSILDGLYDKKTPHQIKGKGGIIDFSAASAKREVTDKATLMLLLGEKNFVKLSSFTLKDIDAYLTPEERAQVLTTDAHGGSRSMTVIITD